MHKQELPYDEWLKTIPPAFTEDSLWHLEAYRLSLYFSDLAWRDMDRVREGHPALFFLAADQLYANLCKIGAKIAFGFSVPFGTTQQNAYHDSLHSAQEIAKWYDHCCFILGEELVTHRLGLITTIIHHLTLLTQVPSWLLFRHFKEQEWECPDIRYDDSLVDALREDAEEDDDALVAYLLSELDIFDTSDDDSLDDNWCCDQDIPL